MPFVPDPLAFDKFSDWLADEAVQREIKDTREALQCTLWQAVVALYLPMLSIPLSGCDCDMEDEDEEKAEDTDEPWKST
jgi:hypothetical protein